MMGRDSHLIKEFLQGCNSVQLLLGIYRYEANPTITIPQFLRHSDEWLEVDEAWAEVELATYLTKTIPPQYLIYQELKDEETVNAFGHAFAARQFLKEWADRILA
jgi:hypothetical protein